MTDFNDLCLNCFEERHGKNPCPSCGLPVQKTSEAGFSLRAGTILNGKYLVGKTLGKGGFGITYLGFDLNLKSKIAIKEYFLNGFVTRNGEKVIPLNRQFLESFREGVELFYHEAESLAKFRSSPVIVNVYDFFRENGTAYIVLEYITGTTLSAYLAKRGGKIDVGETLKILSPVMDALAQLHQQDLLHRDVSPDNILLAADGRIRLIDFGAAMPAMKGNRENLPTILKCGYAPIEQYTLTGKQGPWTDLYALAATMYQALTGETVPESTDRMTEDTLKSPAEKGVVLPAAANRAIMKALSVQAENRFRSVAEFRAALETKESPDDPPKSLATVPKRPPAEKSRKKRKPNPEPGAPKRPPIRGPIAPFVRVGILILVYLALANGLHVLFGNPLELVLFPRISGVKPIGGPAPIRTATQFMPSATRSFTATPLPGKIPAAATSETPSAAATAAAPANTIASVKESESPLTLTPPRQQTAQQPTPTATMQQRAAGRVRESDNMSEVNIVAGSVNFWIDVREVSNQQYLNYAVQSGKFSSNTSNMEKDAPTIPKTNLSRSDAANYCAAMGGRLPTLREWLIAANPGADLSFDGNFIPTVHSADMNCESLRVNAVDNFRYPANPNGVHDLYGNVWEWVNGAPDAEIIERFSPGTDQRFVVVGGSWKSGCDAILDPSRMIETGTDRDDVGFRCVRDE